MKRIVGVIVLLAVCVLAAAPYYYGMEAKQSLEAQLETINQRLATQMGNGVRFELSMEDYQLGYLSSSATMGLHLGMSVPDKESVEMDLSVSQRIEHGPWTVVDLDGTRGFARYSVFSDFELASLVEAVRVAITSAKGEEPDWTMADVPQALLDYPPIQSVSVYSFERRHHAIYSAQAFDSQNDQAQVSWSGFSGQSDMADDLLTGTFSLDSERFVLKSLDASKPPFEMSVNGIHAQGDNRAVSDTMAVGKQSLSMQRVAFSAPDDKLVAIDDVKFALSTDVVDDAFQFAYELSFGNADLPEEAVQKLGKLDGGRFGFGLDGLDFSALEEFMEVASNLDPNVPQEELGMAMMPAMMNLATKSLAHDPRLTLGFSLDLADSNNDPSVDMDLKVSGLGLAEVMKNPMAALAKLSGNLHVALPTAWVKGIVEQKQLKEMGSLAGVDMTPEQMQAAAKQSADQMVGMVLAQGFVVEKGEMLLGVAKLEPGMQLTLNGKPMPLQGLLGGQ